MKYHLTLTISGGGGLPPCRRYVRPWLKLNAPETCGSESSHISKIVDGIKNLLLLAKFAEFKLFENIIICNGSAPFACLRERKSRFSESLAWTAPFMFLAFTRKNMRAKDQNAGLRYQLWLRALSTDFLALNLMFAVVNFYWKSLWY